MNKTYNPPVFAPKKSAATSLPKTTLTTEEIDRFVESQEAQKDNLHKLWSCDAKVRRARMAVYLDAGFTRQEAFAIIMKEVA
jgi:hypothetical protein